MLITNSRFDPNVYLCSSPFKWNFNYFRFEVSGTSVLKILETFSSIIKLTLVDSDFIKLTLVDSDREGDTAGEVCDRSGNASQRNLSGDVVKTLRRLRFNSTSIQIKPESPICHKCAKCQWRHISIQ